MNILAAQLSPYHLLPVSSEEDDKVIQQLENQLLFAPPSSHQNHARRGEMIPFYFVADNLEKAYEASSTVVKQNTATMLTQEALLHCEHNQTLEVFSLLRLCLPTQDNRSVYGFKTHRLLKSFAKALEKCGGLSGKTASAYLLDWIRHPIPSKRGKTLICMPEIAVAHAHSMCFPHSLSISRDRDRCLSTRDIASLCQRLTNMYKEKHKEVVVAATGEAGNKNITGIRVDKIAEVLATVIPMLDYLECKTLVRVLLRSVTMGIGPKTLTGSFGPNWEKQLDYQMDLGRFSLEVVKGGLPSTTPLCGVPFRCMTCDVISSPYVMKWLFGKEESIKSYLPPKDGRLVVHSNGHWYVPLKRSRSAQRKRFVDLESNGVLNSPYIKTHMKVLREIKRNKDLFVREEVGYGMLISYLLSRSSVGQNFSFLILGMKPMEDADIEFVDADVQIEEASSSSTTLTRSKDKKQANTQANEGMDTIVGRFVVSPDVQQRLTGMTITATTSNLPKKVDQTSQGMIVQRKYDGDRLQAHIAMANGRPKVQLFSKKGKPVHHLYTDVATEIEAKFLANTSLVNKALPCILDGEIIVVDSDRQPLPWSSTKWRYDSGKGGMSIEEAALQQGSNKAPVVVSVITEGKYGENLEDGENNTLLSLMPLSTLKNWDQLGSNEKKKMRVKALNGARLLFVIFDTLMVKGKIVAQQPYSERLALIKGLSFLSGLTYSQVIPETYFIQNAQQLVNELSKAVQAKAEGLILKDPRAEYKFGKTNAQRKLKICGPDINCAVVGLGFTLSKNPRMWGILTAILSEDMNEFIVYNRVESIEGDSPSTAAEHILSLSSCVQTCSLLGVGRQKKETEMEKYIIVSHTDEEEVLHVTWIPKDYTTKDYGCTVCFVHGLPQDIQWLCNPFECAFGVSQRGDLYPIPLDLPGRGDATTIWVPRFPVCRIQLDDHQRSDCDTPGTIQQKFQQAAVESTCIQEFIKRRVRLLRCKPPRLEKLEDLRRLLVGKDNQSEPWPQRVDTLFKLDDFSSLLVKNGFEPLTQGERHVLCGFDPISQWDLMLAKKIRIIESEETLAANEGRDASLPFLSNSLRRFKKLIASRKLYPPPIAITRAKLSVDEKNQGFLSKDGKLKNEAGKTVFTSPLLHNQEEDDLDEEMMPLMIMGEGWNTDDDEKEARDVIDLEVRDEGSIPPSYLDCEERSGGWGGPTAAAAHAAGEICPYYDEYDGYGDQQCFNDGKETDMLMRGQYQYETMEEGGGLDLGYDNDGFCCDGPWPLQCSEQYVCEVANEKHVGKFCYPNKYELP